MASLKDVAAGIQVLAPYSGGWDKHAIDADHDVIWVGPEFDSIEAAENGVSTEDRECLKRHGWFVSSEVFRWSRFV